MAALAATAMLSGKTSPPLCSNSVTTLVDDFLPTNETQGTSGAVCSSIYAAKFGRQGVLGLDNGGIQVERVGELETKDATRTRVKWYCGLALFGTLGLSRLKGINAS